MTYREFKKANISLEAFGLEERGTRSDYLCAPKFTRALYFTGVDGIHYAFVRGFAEMVFAISPANIAGECVHPVARDFGDFLALLARIDDEVDFLFLVGRIAGAHQSLGRRSLRCSLDDWLAAFLVCFS